MATFMSIILIPMKEEIVPCLNSIGLLMMHITMVIIVNTIIIGNPKSWESII